MFAGDLEPLAKATRFLEVFQLHAKHLVHFLYLVAGGFQFSYSLHIVGFGDVERGWRGAVAWDIGRVNMPSARNRGLECYNCLRGRNPFQFGGREFHRLKHLCHGFAWLQQKERRYCEPKGSAAYVCRDFHGAEMLGGDYFTSTSFSLKISVANGGTLPSPCSP